jgi:hypothetical protein
LCACAGEEDAYGAAVDCCAEQLPERDLGTEAAAMRAKVLVNGRW